MSEMTTVRGLRHGNKPDLTSTSDTRITVVVPVKAFQAAKSRLSPRLAPQHRRTLARSMAEKVLAAASPLPVIVLCNDSLVARWAHEQGARVLLQDHSDLNRSIISAVRKLASEGTERVIVAHSDLPLARELAWVGDFSGISLIPDHRHQGSNVISVPANAGFSFSYGPGSLHRHTEEAQRLNLPLRVIHDHALSMDLDLPSDLDMMQSRGFLVGLLNNEEPTDCCFTAFTAECSD